MILENDCPYHAGACPNGCTYHPDEVRRQTASQTYLDTIRHRAQALIEEIDHLQIEELKEKRNELERALWGRTVAPCDL